MKKILRSFLVLGLVSLSVAAVTRSGAWFTDQEEVLGNRIDTGTIDIEVGESDETTYNLKDMKPSQVDYLDFVVHNVGSNPLNLFKTLSNYTTGDVETSEPECLAEGGVWDGEECDDNDPVTNLQAKIRYDLRVELYPEEPTGQDPVWWETIYMDEDDVRLSSLNGNPIYLGMVPAGWYMKVMQSYHMPDSVGNKYQGDWLEFDIAFDAEQLGKSVLALENKHEANGDESHHVWDGIGATLSYTIRERTFDYTLTTQGIGTDYTLVAWEDPTYQWNWASRSDAIVLAHLTDGLTGSVDLNRDLIDAKVWLVPGTFGTVGSTAGNFAWAETTTLFETGLMDYYDADLH